MEAVKIVARAAMRGRARRRSPLVSAPSAEAFVARPRVRRALLWGTLVALLVVAQTLLVTLTVSHEASRAQDEAEAAVADAAIEIRRSLYASMQALQALAWGEAAGARWHDAVDELLARRRELLRIERRDAAQRVVDAVDTPYAPRLFELFERSRMDLETEAACSAARRSAMPQFSRSYFVPQTSGLGQEVIDLCVVLRIDGASAGYAVGTFSLSQLLDAALSRQQARRFELSFFEGDGTRLARAGLPRGSGLYRAERAVDLPGIVLQLRADSAAGRPSLIPTLSTALVLTLSVALFGLLLLLARDVRRRATAERALADALALRKAMEDSLSTGLRARDLEGRLTYVNPAFCAMVGYSAEELCAAPVPPYWPSEFRDQYLERQRLRLRASGGHASREGFETVYVRKNGERFPVMIYEAPLVDSQGRQTGWMGTAVDVSGQRGVEELARLQQDRLQATARLVTVGEMASLLSHELNQPLAAIASYSTGSLNLIGEADGELIGPLRQALARIEEQAERAGRIIKSVHDFVRRRRQQQESIAVDELVDGVLPLVRLSARKSGARIEVDLPAEPPRLVCDRTMLEQVLLNLTRNGLQAMELATDLDARVLTLRVRVHASGAVAFSVVDAGPGIAPDVAERLFTPFFTTRGEGMGLGLSLVRTVVEQHGGSLEHGPGPGGRGTEFSFTLPARGRHGGGAAEHGEAATPQAA